MVSSRRWQRNTQDPVHFAAKAPYIHLVLSHILLLFLCCQTSVEGWRQEHVLQISHIFVSLNHLLFKVYSPTVLFASELRFQFRERLFHRNPACNSHSVVFVLFSTVTQAILGLLFCLCRASVPTHSILQQPRFSELTSLDIHG